MRTPSLVVLAALVLASACDLQPPPKKRPPAAKPADLPPPPDDTAGRGSDGSGGSAAAPTPPPAPPAPPAPVDAGAPPAPADAFETTAACNDVGVHLAKTIIDEAQDPAQKAALEQERTRIVRRTAEACTRGNWPEASRACFNKAATTAEMQICGKNLAAPKE